MIAEEHEFVTVDEEQASQADQGLEAIMMKFWALLPLHFGRGTHALT